MNEKNTTIRQSEVQNMAGEYNATTHSPAHSVVCLREDGTLESPSTISIVRRTAKKRIPGLENFHFHMIRHTYTTNLLANGAAPKDVQELLGHSDITTTMGTYAHGTRETKRTSARLMDKVAAEK